MAFVAERVAPHKKVRRVEFIDGSRSRRPARSCAGCLSSRSDWPWRRRFRKGNHVVTATDVPTTLGAMDLSLIESEFRSQLSVARLFPARRWRSTGTASWPWIWLVGMPTRKAASSFTRPRSFRSSRGQSRSLRLRFGSRSSAARWDWMTAWPITGRHSQPTARRRCSFGISCRTAADSRQLRRNST